jgi:hypothetical protein
MVVAAPWETRGQRESFEGSGSAPLADDFGVQAGEPYSGCQGHAWVANGPGADTSLHLTAYDEEQSGDQKKESHSFHLSFLQNRHHGSIDRLLWRNPFG